MKVYHITVENDKVASGLVRRARAEVEAAQGSIHPSFSFGVGPAIVVVELPADADSEQLFPDHAVVLAADVPDQDGQQTVKDGPTSEEA